jgi:hypothetical protein
VKEPAVSTSERHLLPNFGDLIIHLAADRVPEIAAAIEERLRQPWSRRPESEQDQGVGVPAVFQRDEATGQRPVGVWLYGRDDQEIYVSNIVPLGVGSLTHAEYNDALTEFAEEFAIPAAESLGGHATLDVEPYDIAEVIGRDAYSKLMAFSRSSNRSTGTAHPSDKAKWHAFILAVRDVPDHEPPDASRLIEWFQADGWGDEAAYELGIEYERAMALLDYASR